MIRNKLLQISRIKDEFFNPLNPPAHFLHQFGPGNPVEITKCDPALGDFAHFYHFDPKAFRGQSSPDQTDRINDRFIEGFMGTTDHHFRDRLGNIPAFHIFDARSQGFTPTVHQDDGKTVQ